MSILCNVLVVIYLGATLFFGFCLCKHAAINVLYWELPPLITSNKEGFIPEIFQQADLHCDSFSSKYDLDISKHHKISESLDELNSMLYSNKTNEEMLPNGVPYNTAFLAPYIVSGTEAEHEMFRQRGLAASHLYTSVELAVVVNRSNIALFQKIMDSVRPFTISIIYAIVFTCIVGMFLWLLEHRSNPQFAHTFLQGSGTGVWCSFVTLSTVGYGDTFPITFAGRVVIMTWIMVGLTLSALMTGLLMDGVSSSVDVTGKTISVLENTTAARIAGDLQGIVVLEKSYHDALHNVRNGKSFVALVSSDIVASHWDHFEAGSYQERLSAVSSINAEQHYHYLTFKEQWSPFHDILQCILTGHVNHIVYSTIKTKRFVKKVTIDHPSIREMVLYDFKTQLLLFLMLGFLGLAFVLEISMVRWSKFGLGSIKIQKSERATKEVFWNEMLKLKMCLKNEQRTRTNCNDTHSCLSTEL